MGRNSFCYDFDRPDGPAREEAVAGRDPEVRARDAGEQRPEVGRDGQVAAVFERGVQTRLRPEEDLGPRGPGVARGTAADLRAHPLELP